MKEKKSRLNVAFSHTIRPQLEGLVEKTGAGSIVEVVRKALEVYDKVVDAKEKGHKVVIRKGGEEREVIFL